MKLWPRAGLCLRDRPKFGFGFGYGAETDLAYSFGLVTVTAKVHWHKFGFGRNITLKRRNCWNCKICVNFNTGSLSVRLLAAGGDKAVLVLVSTDGPKLDSTASHPSSSSHSLPHRVVCHPGHPAPTIMGGLALRLQCACFVYFYCWSAVCFDFGYGYGRKLAISFGGGFGYGHNWTSVTASLSATAETGKIGFGQSLLCLIVVASKKSV